MPTHQFVNILLLNSWDHFVYEILEFVLQVIVQRTLSSKNMTHVKAGCILAGMLKFLPLFMLVFPGMASRVLFPDKVACVVPENCKEYCDNEAGCTNVAYVELVLHVLPEGKISRNEMV